MKKLTAHRGGIEDEEKAVALRHCCKWCSHRSRSNKVAWHISDRLGAGPVKFRDEPAWWQAQRNGLRNFIDHASFANGNEQRTGSGDRLSYDPCRKARSNGPPDKTSEHGGTPRPSALRSERLLITVGPWFASEVVEHVGPFGCARRIAWNGPSSGHMRYLCFQEAR